MIETGHFDAATMKKIVLAYWDGGAWELEQHWGASALDGYIVYSVVRTALEFKDEIQREPTTMRALECMLLDHTSRGLPTTLRNGERWFHVGCNPWNSWSEDFMGFALGYASADVWLSTTETQHPYDDRFFADVGEAVEMAFSADTEGPLGLTLGEDPDPKNTDGNHEVMMRNHDEYSPVYGTVLLKHLTDINHLYVQAGFPPRFTCANKPENVDALFRWVAGKIEANATGAGFVYRDDGCQRRDGVVSYCDDRPGDPAGTPGARREPGHYPIARALADLCIADNLEYFSASCEPTGPAGIEQAPHNFFFNCVFPEDLN